MKPIKKLADDSLNLVTGGRDVEDVTGHGVSPDDDKWSCCHPKKIRISKLGLTPVIYQCTVCGGYIQE